MSLNHPIFHLRHPTPAIFAWNRLLRSHPNPVSLYPRLLRHGSHPDSYTFPLLLPRIPPAALPQFHTHILLSGHLHHPHVLSSLISAYSSLPSDLLLFLPTPLPDLPTANSLLTALLRANHIPHALTLFDEMPQRNTVSWSTLIHGHLEHDNPCAALSLFRSMLADPRAPTPNEFTLSSVLSACARLTSLRHGTSTHSLILRLRLPLTPALATSLIEMYSKCGLIEPARKVFAQLPPETRDPAAWTAAISALALHGLASEALAAFRDMVLRTVPPNSATFVAVLQACAHGGLVLAGERLFAGMHRDYGVEPAVEHYGCMVDLYGRAGEMDRAWRTVGSMPMDPDALIWGAILSGSRAKGDVVSCEAAMGELIEIQRGNSGGHVMMSNVYAGKGRWDGVWAVRGRMERLGVKKTAGCSSVEIDGEIYEFFAGEGWVPGVVGLGNNVVDDGGNSGNVVVDLDGEQWRCWN